MSCQKAQKFFEHKDIGIQKKTDAKKQKIEEKAAWEIISGFQTVYIGKGKKVLQYSPGTENKAEILKNALGRTGSLRAPAVQTDDALFVGFNEDMYSGL